jgi:hypothetical protein
MGSVPRINRLLKTVFIKKLKNIINKVKVFQLYKQLPYTLKLAILYPIFSNSKAA